MIFKNAMSFKSKIKEIAIEKGISTQQVQQNYLIEAFLIKLSKSSYRNNFIIKGGYLIGGIVGLDNRATMDLDTTVKGFDLTINNLSKIARLIVKVPTEESFEFEFEGVEEIRKIDTYPGYRIKMIASFEKIREVVTVDVTSGDAITPKEIDFNFRMIFSDEKIELLSYPIETILAEKIETILSRGVGTTRPRDYYDVYILYKLKLDVIHYGVLKDALFNTKGKRQSIFKFSESNDILGAIRNSTFQQQLWAKYQSQYVYAKELSFDEVLDSFTHLVSEIDILSI
ncbi:nucleotidyl transferase AbiEii/AbiGii toxin family protein [Granulicatella seriolae]|uniref:Nucleotidyl transferase AbiEii/AbiGii toxin family protein n=1 Tax=Granulicatella seriolae TaxID=2967226 RepID=A0ABT1WPZ5_9LACT|nr:nucleotidyl transferase AbiEii/AbiGii toxin family protein [Granulicatella seriolae]